MRYLFIILSLLFSNSVFSAAKKPDELGVYPPYLFSILKLIEWPSIGNDAVKFCVIGEPFLVPAIEHYAEDKTIHLLPVTAERKEYRDDISECHAVYIGSLVRGDVTEYIDSFNKAPIVIFGHRDGFLEQGGMINFVVVEEKLRFELNVDNISAAQLTPGDVLTSLSTTLKDQGSNTAENSGL